MPQLNIYTACLAAFFAHSFYTGVRLALAAALVGLGFNAFAVSIQKLIGNLPAPPSLRGELPAQSRKRHFGTLATSTSLSSFFGPLLAGWALDRLAAPQVFALLAALPLLAWCLTLGWRLVPDAPAAGQVAAGAKAARAIDLWRARGMWPLALAIVMLTVAGDAVAFLTPVIGQQQGLSATAVGAVLSSVAAGAFMVRLLSGLFIARLSEWAYLRATFFAAAAMLVGYGQLSSVPALMALSFALGAWLGLAQPMTQSLMHQSVPADRIGEALGGRLALVGTAQAASPLLFGLAAQNLGTAASLVLAGVVLICSGLLVRRWQEPA